MIYKLATGVIQYFCFSDKPMKGGNILDFKIGENLRKGGVDTPLANYVLSAMERFCEKC